MSLQKRALTLWFTGLSGSGKSTLSERVFERLKAGGMATEYLDGDAIRSVFPTTGFLREERNMHIKRVGFLASILERNGISVVASFVSPYRESRDFVRSLCPGFIEVYVSTPLAVCEKRDIKGLYRKARLGEIPNFTGVSDPYEAPQNPELALDTSQISIEAGIELIMEKVKSFHPSR